MFASIAFRGCLNPGEKIYFVAHTHPFIMYKIFFKTLIFGLLLPLGFNVIMPPFAIVWYGWIAVGGLIFFYEIMNWYLDAWIITNHGIIDLQWNSFFDKSSTRIEYHTVEGITYQVKGFWGTIMNYGDIMIERLGTGTVVTLESVAFPKKVEREVLHYQEKFVRAKNFKDETALRDMLLGMLQRK
ncbi:MAG: hypothetical protein ABII07_00990 [Patescibacteria group bacterium]|nr:hypothetical protein [Patescibacteria group bacterium]